VKRTFSATGVAAENKSEDILRHPNNPPPWPGLSVW